METNSNKGCGCNNGSTRIIIETCCGKQEVITKNNACDCKECTCENCTCTNCECGNCKCSDNQKSCC